mmetsp:Transcript_19386/g.68627  ORF Transcript_19386/g.68627 Transcript_19386/m.68627 type:complete len:223 (-) Transcript_19386:402-1070(-)
MGSPLASIMAARFSMSNGATATGMGHAPSSPRRSRRTTAKLPEKASAASKGPADVTPAPAPAPLASPCTSGAPASTPVVPSSPRAPPPAPLPPRGRRVGGDRGASSMPSRGLHTGLEPPRSRGTPTPSMTSASGALEPAPGAPPWIAASTPAAPLPAAAAAAAPAASSAPADDDSRASAAPVAPAPAPSPASVPPLEPASGTRSRSRPAPLRRGGPSCSSPL